MKRTLFPLIGLCLYGFLATATFSCPATVVPTVITFARIAQQARPLVLLLQQTRTASEQATTVVNASYSDLSGYLKANDFDGEVIQAMEQSLYTMRSRADTLQYLLSLTEGQSEQLFQLLEARAEQNTTEVLRESMLEDIENKRVTFNGKMEIAENVLTQINSSIQKYDDILGYIQVSESLAGIDEQVSNINEIIQEGNQLNTEILTAIDDGLAIVSNIEEQAERNSKSETPNIQ